MFRPSFNDHFSRQAADYAKFRPRYPEQLFRWLESIAPSNELAWDCATGNGQAAVELAKVFARVIATDGSEKQVANAERHPRIEYRVATAEDSGLESSSVDLITVAQALHYSRRCRHRLGWLRFCDARRQTSQDSADRNCSDRRRR